MSTSLNLHGNKLLRSRRRLLLLRSQGNRGCFPLLPPSRGPSSTSMASLNLSPLRLWIRGQSSKLHWEAAAAAWNHCQTVSTSSCPAASCNLQA
ncbi:hypothetical protein PVAP13_8KG260200 [Panicum virgatum]|uniref:Uncharacterized protein n=1 Tax=Panicum virgatum TaxID=38727 RepID=A0A8T0PP47_PANVG|nr:hypothetical protein PVAP13_8KG260200 [Panicum virgatum]